MAQFVCQVLTHENKPFAGMRVTCAVSTLYTYEGISSSNGIVTTWRQTPHLELHSMANQDYTRCHLAFATEEYFGDVPWPMIHVDIKLSPRLSNYILLRCDRHSYNIYTHAYEPGEPSTIDNDNRQQRECNDQKTAQHLGRGKQSETDTSNTDSAFPFPMKSFEFQHGQGGRRARNSRRGKGRRERKQRH
ncbi:hypothetical protein GGR54DRAFT_615478 [Hypoxylon sp. NC1633]|nr:hypothetical protein GGR54DRAFT_615478 [Hypoxylon sp. NC1633]